MSPLFAPAIEAATRTFSDNAELKHSAAELLTEDLSPDADAQAAMAARWEEVDSRNRKSFWPILLWLTVALVSITVVVRDAHELSRLFYWGQWIHAGSIFAPLPAKSEKLAAERLTADQKLLAFGDLTKSSKSDRLHALWQSEPENPAYFADYAKAFVADHNKLPPDFLQTARRIDPTNSWFTYLAAAVEADDCVKAKSRRGKKMNGTMVYETSKSWEILDPPKLNRALELIAYARGQTTYNSYAALMLRKRISLLQQESYLEHLDSVNCLNGFCMFSTIRLRKLADVLAAKAWSIGEAGAASEFGEITQQGEQFLQRLSHEYQGAIVDELVNKVVAATLAESFATAAQKLGLANDAARWKRIDERFEESKQRKNSREFYVDGKVVTPGTLTGTFIGGSTEMLARQAENPPPLTQSDLKPARLLDHEFLSWIFSYLAAVVIALAACSTLLYQFRVSLLSRSLARRMEELLRPSDWRWMILAGIVVPFLFVFAVNRLTPLGGRDYGAQGTAFLMPAGHFMGLLLLWLVLPVQIIRWRIAKRAEGPAFTKPLLAGWLASACAAAFVPVVGLAALAGTGRLEQGGLDSLLGAATSISWPFWAAVVLAAIASLWAVGLASLAMLGRPSRHLSRATSARVLAKLYAVALIILAATSIAFKAAEHHWFKEDWMSKLDPTGPGWSAYESKVALQMRKELREAMGHAPSE